MQSAYGTINQTLVTLFNHIMRIEERALIIPGLSIREVHVIENVCDAVEDGDNAMSDLASRLHITAGSLSVSVSTLVKKGYLTRMADETDKRISRVLPTSAAIKVNEAHCAFHREMTDSVIGHLSPMELSALEHALNSIDTYFTDKERVSE